MVEGGVGGCRREGDRPGGGGCDSFVLTHFSLFFTYCMVSALQRLHILEMICSRQ